MGSMFPDPFGMMGPPALTGPRQRQRGPFDDLQMMPFGFPSFGFPMPSMNPEMMLSNFVSPHIVIDIKIFPFSSSK